MTNRPKDRTGAFCDRFGLLVPIVEAPMAGACPVARSVAIAAAGGMGALGALLTPPEGIAAWASAFRAGGGGAFQINLWVPDRPPVRDVEHECALRAFLAEWGPAVPADAADATPPDFGQQCEAILDARPTAASSIMGLFEAKYVARLKEAGIAWFATATTLGEALAAEVAGADAIIAQGYEAGGHRGTFDSVEARTTGVGLMALVPALADRVQIPVIAAGGVADGRGVAAALILGASAVMLGTAFLRCAEADTAQPWADALAQLAPEDVAITRAFSGRPGRAIRTAYVRAAAAPSSPEPAPYPVQRALTAAMRAEGARQHDLDRMQAWAGQSAALAATGPASDIVERVWAQAQDLLA